MRYHDVHGAAAPDRVCIIGGGRWARVLTGVVCDLVTPRVGVSVHSLHNAEAMQAWAVAQGLDRRIAVSCRWPDVSREGPSAVIVANAAREHEPAVEWAIDAGYAVLIEKPVAGSYPAARRLADLARGKTRYLAAAHVFLFARYIRTFAKLVMEIGNIRRIGVRWSDPEREHRYGEMKTYDAGLPVFADCLPHILSIIGTILPASSCRCETLEVFKGGAHLELDLVCDDVPCHVQLIRDGECRQRTVEVAAEAKTVRLDFSNEPGTITVASTSINGDPEWNMKPRPLASMLAAFFQGVVGGEQDERLDIELGIRAASVIDHTAALYRAVETPNVRSSSVIPA